MASEPAPPSCDDQAFSFKEGLPQRIPRAWERTPKSPFGGRHGGRKVWKRYGTIPKDHVEKDEEKGVSSILLDATNTLHAAKRLRLKAAPEDLHGGKENKCVKYLATLRDESEGTPKRKHVQHKSLELDREAILDHQVHDEIPPDTVAWEETVREDSLRASQSPALEEAREMLYQSHSDIAGGDEEHMRDKEKDVEDNASLITDTMEPTGLQSTSEVSPGDDETEESCHTGTAAADREHGAAIIESIDAAPKAIGEPLIAEEAGSASPLPEINDPAWASRDLVPENCPINAEHFKPSSSLVKLETSPLYAAKAPFAGSLGPRLPDQMIDMISAGCSSPQIGTSLLRRESLRNRDTPSKKLEPTGVRGAEKRDTLSRRDTLQEREILQRVIAETNQDPHATDVKEANSGVLAASDSSSGIKARDTNQSGTTARLESAILAGQPTERTASDVEFVRSHPNDASIAKDLHRAIEAIEVFEQPTYKEAGTLNLSNQPSVKRKGATRASALTNQSEEIQNINKANEIIAEAEFKEAMQSAEGVNRQTESPHRKTRSGTRFSDDTSMLRDFLSRAQASKAAKTPIIPPLDAPKPQISPRRSPRKAHGTHNSISSTPQQLVLAANQPGTPPEGTRPDTLESDDADEVAATPTSCRRSTRTRPPAPAKGPPGVPSFIPVKRADGSDPVVLQKSQAQELAMVTRANTRRNKGQSKPPLLALKEIPAETSQADIKERGENGKAVGWAEKLASYHDGKEKGDETEELKPKVRRMRGLGAANGTPAPKKTVAVVDTSNSTPAPKRRGRGTAGK